MRRDHDIDNCGCCSYMRGELATVHAKLDALHSQLVRIETKVEKVMAAQDDINGADSALQQLVALAPQIVAAVQAGGTPVTTAQLATDTTSATSALASIKAVLPAAPPPAPAQPPVVAPAAQDVAFAHPGQAPPANPFA